MIEIDGSKGEGGGQIVRSSLALSLLSGKSFRIFNVRAGRKKPGLKRQHLAAVNAAARVGCASVTGAELGSNEISFIPGPIVAGHYDFRIDTAGSVTLVLQTVLPPLMVADATSYIRLRGGTHNRMAPTYDFLKNSFLGQLEKFGPLVELDMVRQGFYPVGGGEFSANITPSETLSGVQLVERGKLKSRRITAIVSQLPISIARRETSRAIRKLNWDRTEIEHIEVQKPLGPGNVLFTQLEYEHVTTMFTSFGQRGVSSEQVADRLVRDVKNYLRTDAPVGPNLADQILLPMAIAAWKSGAESSFRTGPLSDHTTTHMDIIRKFLDVKIIDTQCDDQTELIRVEPELSNQTAEPNL